MSAISLVWNAADAPPAGELNQSILSALERYGPKRQASWSGQGISLGACLSCSLPEDAFDIQPLWSPDRAACLVADVRLDNRAALARELGLTQPEELSDSAILMSAWLRWGEACLDHILGGFAFAIWLPQRQQVFAARDHAGERPLFYHRGTGLFALSSMPKGLLALPGQDARVNDSYATEWLASLSHPWDQSFFQQISRLPPSHLLRFTPQSFQVKQYWHPSHARPLRFPKDSDYPEALLEIFDSATSARLRSTRPAGSCLSAGLDSSSVTASAAHLLAAEGRPLVAFTAVPRPGCATSAPNGFFASEAAGAADVARLYPNIEHILVDSGSYPFLPTIRLWIEAQDEPAPSPINSLWLKAIYDCASQRGLGVVLDGSSGNATFSYNNWSILARFLRRGRWIDLARTAHQLNRSGALRWTSAVRLAAGGLIPAWLRQRRVPPDTRASLLACLVHPQRIERGNLHSRILDSFYPAPQSLAEEHSALFDGFDEGPFRASVEALTGVQVRDPTADKRLFEFAFAIPPEQFIAGGQSRSLARRAMRERLPPSVLNCTARGFQGADWHATLTSALPELRSELKLLTQSPAARQIFDLPAMQAMLDAWPEPGGNLEQYQTRWNFWLTRAFSMGYFLRTHDTGPIDGHGSPA